MATYYVKSGAGAAEFAQSNAYTSGQKIVPKRSDTGTNHLIAKRYVWECTTAGTSAGAEPTWPASVTADTTTVTSNTAVFTARKPGYSSGTTANWAFATIYADYVGALAVAGDTVYISHQHAENVGTVWGVTNAGGSVSGVSYLCVNDGATPPTTLATTATITTTGAFNISIGTGNSYWYGVTSICGATDNGNRLLSTVGTFEQCSFQLATTGAGATIVPQTRWINCTVKFATAGQSIVGAGNATRFEWIGGSLLAGGTSPTALFGNSFMVRVEGVDLSNASAAINLTNSLNASGSMEFTRIKLPTSWSGAVCSSILAGLCTITLTAGDTTGTNYIYRSKRVGGETFSETTIVRTGGGSDGVTPLSHKLVCTSGALFPTVWCTTPDIVKRNLLTGSPLNVTMELVHDSVTALKDNEAWIEVTYFSDSGSPLGTMVTSRAVPMATPASLTSSSETWTTTGMNNPNKRKITVSITPQLKGFISVRGYLAKASTTAYFCPKVTVSP